MWRLSKATRFDNGQLAGCVRDARKLEIERALSVARARMEGGVTVAGVVRVGGFTSFVRTVVIPRLPEWRIRYPQLQIRIVEDDFRALVRLLRQRALDAVVVELDSTTAVQH